MEKNGQKGGTSKWLKFLIEVIKLAVSFWAGGELL
jgi:hypothetical protein